MVQYKVHRWNLFLLATIETTGLGNVMNEK